VSLRVLPVGVLALDLAVLPTDNDLTQRVLLRQPPSLGDSVRLAVGDEGRAVYFPASSRSKRGLPRSGAKLGSIRSHSRVRK
jgi:hypothetical protein